MCESKAIEGPKSKFLLLATSFCIYQAHTDNKLRHNSKNKNQVLRQNDYKKYCLNNGECYYLVDEDIVGCNFTWLYG